MWMWTVPLYITKLLIFSPFQSRWMFTPVDKDLLANFSPDHIVFTMLDWSGQIWEWRAIYFYCMNCLLKFTPCCCSNRQFNTYGSLSLSYGQCYKWCYWWASIPMAESPISWSDTSSPTHNVTSWTLVLLHSRVLV